MVSLGGERPIRIRRVAFVLKDLGGGGAERMMLRLAAGVRASGFEVDVVLFAVEGELVGAVDPDVSLVDLRTGRSSRSVPALVRYLGHRRPDAVFTTLRHTAVAVATAHRLARGRRRLVIREANDLGAFLEPPTTSLRGAAFRRAVRWAYRQSALLTAVSDGVAAQLRAFVGGDGPSVVTRYNPVVDAALHAAAEGSPPHPWLARDGHRVPVVVAAGRLVPQKDFHTLLAAFARLRERVPARLLVFGEGPERPGLERAVAELGLAEVVALPGFEPRLPAAFAHADAFALSSRWEGLPGVLIQAMACGTPVVATDCPSGPAEVLEGGRWGRLVAVGDVTALAQGLEDALSGRLGPAPPAALERFRVEAAVDRCVEDLFGSGA